jgi:four helix bundle protein
MYQFEKLEIWDKAVSLIKETYSISEKFPKEEKYSLTSQIQRAAVSVALNIAEGRGSQSDREFCKFLFISLRSLHETVAALKIAIELDYIQSNELETYFINAEHLGAQIKSLIKYLKTNDKSRKT